MSLMIQQQVQFHGSLGPPVKSPVKDRRTQIDHRSIHTDQLVLETKLVGLAGGTGGQRLALPQQLLEDIFVQLPRAMLVGVGQGGARRGLRQAQMPQLSFARRQPASNLAQRLGSAELAEQHSNELSPTAEPASVSFGLVLANRRVKSGARNQL